jgi:hypothetical protein
VQFAERRHESLLQDDARADGTSAVLDQRSLKDRPGIKAHVIGPPEAPSVFILFLNWQVNQ